MVSLDQQIQKDREKNKSQRTGRNSSRSNDRRRRGIPRDVFDKRRGIQKDNRRRQGQRFQGIRQDRGPRRNQDHRQVYQQIRGLRIARNKQGRKRISRVSRQIKRDSQDNSNEAAQEKGRTLKVMGLHPDFTNEDLYKLFSTEGALQKCLIEQDNFGRSMTTAIVKYHNAASAKNAIQNLNSHKVMNSILTVEPYKNKRK